VRLFLCARTGSRLDAVAAACRERGAEVETRTVDVRDAIAVRDWLGQCDASRPLDLMIANAGVLTGRAADARTEDALAAADVVATNLSGAVVSATAAAALMAPRGRGQIALISSLAAFFPLADAPAYSASKAGLTAFATALDEAVAPAGLIVTVIHPGHVETAQTAHQQGALPMMVSPEVAARRIVAGLVRGKRRVSFPLTLRVLLGLHGVLPRRLRHAINRPFRFHISDPHDGE
jgi:short-subunit dehydrogenase